MRFKTKKNLKSHSQVASVSFEFRLLSNFNHFIDSFIWSHRASLKLPPQFTSLHRTLVGQNGQNERKCCESFNLELNIITSSKSVDGFRVQSSLAKKFIDSQPFFKFQNLNANFLQLCTFFCVLSFYVFIRTSKLLFWLSQQLTKQQLLLFRFMIRLKNWRKNTIVLPRRREESAWWATKTL